MNNVKTWTDIVIGEKERKIEKFIIHCSATKEYKVFSFKDIEYMHERRFKKIGGCHCGYHFIIYLDGTIIQTKPLEFIGQHTAGNNQNTIGICYIGGLDKNGKPKDTRTMAQKKAINSLLYELLFLYPGRKILGHRDLSPDINKDGKITRNEWIKDCPCYDVISECKGMY